MLAFAAFTPHPLISVPEIGKKSVSKIRNTMRSFRELAAELYAAQPDTIVVLSPHTASHLNAFTINQRPTLVAEFSKYGNLTDRLVFTNDLGFGYKIKESVETKVPIVLTDDETVDYGVAVPLYHLTQHLKSDAIRVAAIGSSALNLQKHYDFGAVINRQIHRVTKRIAVIASGDLSHGASKNSPIGYNPDAFSFNKIVRTAIQHNDTKTLLALKDEQVTAVTECGLKPLIMLMGIIGDRQYRSTLLSYDAALGVGYLSVNFDLH